MGFGALLGLESGISYTATGRDDHPGQALIFEAFVTFCALCIVVYIISCPEVPNICWVQNMFKLSWSLCLVAYGAVRL